MASLTLTDDIADELARAVESGVPLQTAALAAGIAPRTAYQWLNVGETGVWDNGFPTDEASLTRIRRFTQMIATARARFEAKQVQAIREDAEAFNAKTGQRDWRARAWLLNNHPATRKTYRPQHEGNVEHSGQVNHTMTRLEQLSDSELDAIADAQPSSLPDPTNA